MKEYIVTLNKDADLDAFWAEIENSGNLAPTVPVRPVAIVNNRDPMPRLCHYLLTDQEADTLRQDPRVAGVEIPPEHNPDIILSRNRTVQFRDNFNKTSLSISDYVNWGLVRNSSLTNSYGNSLISNIGYGYFVDGTGVDMVIVDSGIQANHPEFRYVGNLTSRVQQIDWFTASGVTGTMPGNFYTDYSGHGTHVAGIAAGQTYGWAKNAAVYAIKLEGLQGATDPGSGLTMDQTFDVLVGWHERKMNPASGYYTGRPTVVNMSFSYGAGIVNNFYLQGGNYRGNNWSTANVWSNNTYGLTWYSGTTCPVRLTSVDDGVETLVDAGINVCIAAGNENLKIDVPGGLDYNNYLTTVQSVSGIGNLFYYQRGASPYSGNALIVGAMDSTVYSSTTDQKATYSMAGPGVDIFAAGSNVMSACSNVDDIGGGQTYYWNSNYKQINIGGTSMASPQVAGIVSFYLEQNPNASPSTVKDWTVNNGTYTIYKPSDAEDNDYNNNRSQWGGNAPVAFSSSQGALVSTVQNNWAIANTVYIKTDSSFWTMVQNIYTKTDANTWQKVY
jgi:subtilisin family serine protease